MYSSQKFQGVTPVKFIRSAIFIIAVLSFSIIPIFAQESEAVVIDEVIAQINDGVLTLSRVKRESKEVIEGLIQEGKKPEEAKALVDGKQGEIIAGLIIEELILQKGKEEGIDSEVEIEVNKRFLSIMKQEKMTTLDALYKAMNRKVFVLMIIVNFGESRFPRYRNATRG